MVELILVVGILAAEPSKDASPKLIRVLLVTGEQHPAHDWKSTTMAVRDVLREDPRFDVRVVEDPAFLESKAIETFDVILLNFAFSGKPDPGDLARENLLRVIESGQGLFVLHFASGAFMAWPEYRDFVGKVWVDNVSSHDPYGPFSVRIVNKKHPITAGMSPFDTVDELYFNLVGDRAIEVLATARSKVDGKDHPMAFVFPLGKGRVFHTTLGHDERAIRNPGTAELIRRGCAWAGKQAPVPSPVPPPVPPPVQ